MKMHKETRIAQLHSDDLGGGDSIPGRGNKFFSTSSRPALRHITLLFGRWWEFFPRGNAAAA
jgi:hypothetical protein